MCEPSRSGGTGRSRGRAKALSHQACSPFPLSHTGPRRQHSQATRVLAAAAGAGTSSNILLCTKALLPKRQGSQFQRPFLTSQNCPTPHGPSSPQTWSKTVPAGGPRWLPAQGTMARPAWMSGKGRLSTESLLRARSMQGAPCLFSRLPLPSGRRLPTSRPPLRGAFGHMKARLWPQMSPCGGSGACVTAVPDVGVSLLLRGHLLASSPTWPTSRCR